MTPTEHVKPEAFPFQNLGPLGCCSRHGSVIVVPCIKAGWRVWGGQIFLDEATANITAARCVSGRCDIVPAKEVIHYAGKPGSFKFRRSILVDWASMRKATQ